MISPYGRIRMGASIVAHPRTVYRVYLGAGSEYSYLRAIEGAKALGLPLPPDRSTPSSTRSPTELPTPSEAA